MTRAVGLDSLRPGRMLAADAPLGALLRLPLRVIPAGARVPVLTTRARGMRWIAGAGPHGCWLGINEVRKRRLFQAVVQPGMVVWDVGANVGSWTMLASACVGDRGRVIAFEPVPANLAHLRTHVALNHLANVTIVERAVSDRSGVVRFSTHADRLQGRIAEEGDLVVDTVTFDEQIAHGAAPAPDVIKIDIEGGEAAALRGGRALLARHRPVVFVATHGEAVHGECLSLLASLGYTVATIGRARDELIARPHPPD